MKLFIFVLHFSCLLISPNIDGSKKHPCLVMAPRNVAIVSFSQCSYMSGKLTVAAHKRSLCYVSRSKNTDASFSNSIFAHSPASLSAAPTHHTCPFPSPIYIYKDPHLVN